MFKALGFPGVSLPEDQASELSGRRLPLEIQGLVPESFKAFGVFGSNLGLAGMLLLRIAAQGSPSLL